jgi:uncharacterized protein (DUF2164 family)
MKKITFSQEEKAAIVGRIQTYFTRELDQEIGMIPAEFLLEFFATEIGGFFYNRGLYDAQAVLAKKIDDISDDIYGLEQREAGVR